ncbi:MAG: S-adenosylmethionine:tRNA ribosyltransferase-isomerase [Ignavibacteriae bacterium]|nr:S-adenosylmethionine:tRNA ribosyltransferase-isomerase [Ignavibacteriota bacterium]MCB9243699.1 S-adenosylmethionine:tRNA ribosyltransferase-isomerase [Ignavibacteriales bacterium]
MNDPKKIRIENYSYELPEERIARYPLEKRDSSKLLVYKDGKISEDIFSHIAEYIPENSVVIFNDTKVIQARILFEREGSKPIEIFCLDPHNKPLETALNAKEQCTWVCMIGNLRKWRSGILDKDFKNGTLHAELKGNAGDNYLVEFSWEPDGITFSEILESIGETPIPPYLKRNAEESDRTRYQTIYAKHEGSVAAPTAGLHFTDEVLAKLRQKNIEMGKVTLHVGAGTFKPVKSELIGEHAMHSEFVTIPARTIDLLTENRNIVCVGTTSLRTIESIPYIAAKIFDPEIRIDQWEPYNDQFLSKTDQNPLKIIQNHLEMTGNDHISAQTGIMIVPGFKFKYTNILVTNFHQPNSTLLLLVSAFVGNDWQKIYDFALKNDFRFLSYGDSSILCRN